MTKLANGEVRDERRNTRVLRESDRVREMLVQAYAHAVMSELLFICLGNGFAVPGSFSEAHDICDANTLGDEFQESFLQFKHPEYAHGTAEQGVAIAFINAMQDMVDGWLRRDVGDSHVIPKGPVMVALRSRDGRVAARITMYGDGQGRFELMHPRPSSPDGKNGDMEMAWQAPATGEGILVADLPLPLRAEAEQQG